MNAIEFDHLMLQHRLALSSVQCSLRVLIDNPRVLMPTERDLFRHACGDISGCLEWMDQAKAFRAEQTGAHSV